MNLAKFLEPPQKKVTASSWLATKACTFSTSQIWCWDIQVTVRCTRFPDALVEPVSEITSICQFPVTMNGLVDAPLQFCADHRFAGAGNAFNQIISPAHGSMIPFRVGQPDGF